MWGCTRHDGARTAGQAWHTYTHCAPGAGGGHITYRRRLLEHLLVAALHAAVALEQVHGVAVCVGEHLQLDVAGLLQVPLDEDAVVAEAGDGFALAGVHAVAEAVGGSDDAHALAAAAQHCLDHHRVPGGGRAWGHACVSDPHSTTTTTATWGCPGLATNALRTPCCLPHAAASPCFGRRRGSPALLAHQPQS